jgi:hypothetical protein
MKNEVKLALIIFSILMAAVGFGWAFNLSLNPQTLQVGNTVYTEKGEVVKGFIPNRKTASDAKCDKDCSPGTSNFAMQCREYGFQVYAGPCCQTLCSGRVATHQEPLNER